MHDSTYSPIQLQLQFPEPEEWREVPGYEGIYEVSDQGRVRTLVTRVRGYKAGTLLRQGTSADGYKTVTLIKNNTGWCTYAHRLVMLAFVGESKGLDVNHKNGIKDDNRLENLEYVTRAENIRHSLEVLKVYRAPAGDPKMSFRFSREQVIDVRNRLAAGETITGISRAYGVSKKAVRFIRDGKTGKCADR